MWRDESGDARRLSPSGHSGGAASLLADLSINSGTKKGANMKFLFSFYKAGPTDHVVKYVGGRERAAGKGLWLLVGPRTTIARVPTTDLAVPLAFTELISYAKLRV